MNSLVLVVLLTLIVCAYSPRTFAQSLTPADIDAAILAGQSGKEKQLVYNCRAMIGFRDIFKLAQMSGLVPSGSFDVSLSLTTGRIAALSAAARRLYKPFAPTAIPQDFKTLAAFLDAEPLAPEDMSGYTSYSSPIQQIVLKTPKGDQVVLPYDLKTEPIEWKNGGRTVKGNRGRARFPVGQIRELPPGDISVVLVTEAGERKCSMGTGDRRRVFGR